jgi:predicted dehydrogenase
MSGSSNRKEISKEFSGKKGKVKLVILAPGHFHANLIQKSNLDMVNDSVFVYAPKGSELDQYLSGVESYNNREDDPTNWKLSTYAGTGFLEKMVNERKGNVVILAGNNCDKTEYIFKSIKAKINVLSDKPLAINEEDFELLEKAYSLAEENNVKLYDIMTERYDILNVVEKMLMNDSTLFGRLEKGTVEAPSIFMESVHHFYKEVSGKPLVRPAWYYDVEQQGEGIADVTTHLIDLIHWKCFPDQSIQYKKDVKVVSASHWATGISLDKFKKSTGLNYYPQYLNQHVKDSVLYVMANGTIHYQVKDVNVGIRVMWKYEAPEEGSDTHSSVFRGTKATLKTIQDKSQDFIKQLYIEKTQNIVGEVFKTNLETSVKKIRKQFPFVTYTRVDEKTYRIEIPQDSREGHEAHFKYVAEKFFGYLAHRNMPDWETANTLSKYYITTTAVTMANR